MLWSDDFQNDGRVFVRRRAHEAYRNNSVVPTVKFGGGGVTVWGAMFYRGTGFLTPLKGNLNKNGYLDILRNSAIPSAHLLGYGDNFIFQDDIVPHATELTLSSSGNPTKACVVKILTFCATDIPKLIILIFDKYFKINLKYFNLLNFFNCGIMEEK